MRRTMIAAAVAATLATAGGALAAPIAVPPSAAPLAVEPVQYYQDWRGGPRDFNEHRPDRWRMRRAYEDERIAEAARREAWRIEQERAERRAWRHEQRERYGYYRGF